MKDRNTMDKTIALLKRHYYANIILMAAAFLLILFRIIPLFTDGQSVGVTMERYAIMITIIAIPVSLKLFAYRLKKITRPLEIPTAVEVYKKASFLRLYTISAVTLMHIILFGISRNMNFFWFTVVLFIVFLFCKPSYEELENLTETSGEQEQPEAGGIRAEHPDQLYGKQIPDEEEQHVAGEEKTQPVEQEK